MSRFGKGPALALAVLMLWACGGGSSQNAASSPSPSPVAVAKSPVAAAVAANVPTHCNDRVSEGDVSAALGKSVVLAKEAPSEASLLCVYDVAGGSQTPIANGRIAYQTLDKDPTQSDVSQFVTTLSQELGAQATIQMTSGVGDYSGFITLTLPNGAGTVWVYMATKGRLAVDFGTWSGFVSQQPDQNAMAAVVRRGLG